MYKPNQPGVFAIPSDIQAKQEQLARMHAQKEMPSRSQERSPAQVAQRSVEFGDTTSD